MVRFPLFYLVAMIFTDPAFPAEWTRAGGIGGGHARQLLHHRGMIYASTDSGLYRSPVTADAWEPFGPQHSGLEGFARNRNGWVLTTYVREPGDGASTRFLVSRDEGATWSESHLDSVVEHIAGHGDTLFAFRSGRIADTCRWISFDGGRTWSVPDFRPRGNLRACALDSAAIRCGSDSGIFQGRIGATGSAATQWLSFQNAHPALAAGPWLYWFDTASILHKSGPRGDAWASAPFPHSNPRFVAATDSTVLLGDDLYLYPAQGRPTAWPRIETPGGYNRFGSMGAWVDGYGFFPALNMGVWRVAFPAGKLLAEPVGRGMDRAWTTIRPVRDGKLYARTGRGFWRLDAGGVFQPFFTDIWGGRDLWIDGQDALINSWFQTPGWSSRDGGRTWTPVPFLDMSATVAGKIGSAFFALAPNRGLGTYSIHSATDPVGPWLPVADFPKDRRPKKLLLAGQRFLALDDSLRASDDTGRTWRTLAVPVGRVDKFVTEGERVLLAGDSGALYLSAERGARWEALGRPIAEPVTVASLSLSEGRAYVTLAQMSGPYPAYACAGPGRPWEALGPGDYAEDGGIASHQGRLWIGSSGMGAFARPDPIAAVRPRWGNRKVSVTAKGRWRDARGRIPAPGASAAGRGFQAP